MVAQQVVRMAPPAKLPASANALKAIPCGFALCATFQAAADRGEVASAVVKLASRRVSGGLLIDLRRLFVIVPPGLGDAAPVARFGRRPAEHVPVGEPVRGLVPVRNPIPAAP